MYKHIIFNDSLWNISFKSKQNRIERYIKYRNLMLSEAQKLTHVLNVTFDYLLIIDLDIFSFDALMLVNEMYHAFKNRSLDVLCANGLDVWGYTRDTFATVLDNGTWLHRPFAGSDDTHSWVSRKSILKTEATLDREQKKESIGPRFFSVKSCFGGLAVYKNIDDIWKSKCKYSSSLAAFEEDSKMYEDLQRFSQLYVYDDGDICEHLSFHVCLQKRLQFKIAIARDVYLYYSRYKVGRNPENIAVNWDFELEQRMLPKIIDNTFRF